jgi:hypothetical protein
MDSAMDMAKCWGEVVAGKDTVSCYGNGMLVVVVAGVEGTGWDASWAAGRSRPWTGSHDRRAAGYFL